MWRGGRLWTWAGVGAVVALVLGLGWLTMRPNWQPRPIVAVEGTVDSHILDVTVAHEDCATGDPRVHATEPNADQIVLSAEYNDDGDCNDVGLQTTVTVELAGEVGNRTVRVRTLDRELDCDIAGSDDPPCVASNSPE